MNVRALLGYWSYKYPTYLTYMLQACGYNVAEYFSWWLRTRDLRSVMKRQTLDMTTKAKLIRAVFITYYVLGVAGVVCLVGGGVWFRNGWMAFVAIMILLIWPTVMAFAVVPLLWAGEALVQKPRERKIIESAKVKAAFLTGLKIAVVGSYGKTSMKEMLQTILSEKLTVRATPGNENTLIGTSRFIETLSDSENVVIFEFGESEVGDIDKLCEVVEPKLGIITGISEAHLASFGSRENLIGTIFELTDYLGDERVYKNVESQFMERISPHDQLAYSKNGVNGWRVSEAVSSLDGLQFIATKNDVTVRALTRLIGEHHIGPLVACIDIAHSLGLSPEQIETGIRKTQAYEHRMQPYELNGAIIIDDTYNGNPTGVYSGLALLRATAARRRVYVTPGLVELGSESDTIHEAIGREIARSADLVVLMKNSTTAHIQKGLEAGGYKGRLVLIGEPLQFYEDLGQFVATGDVVLMQNDWTDNYH